jgi:prolyl-tRNA editing enzyme YbaK/EbsC (Cys-tRNA(Pro) deacylase)
MYDTYQRIFTRCGLQFRAVEADTGNIGGSLSHEFQVLTETGEDALVACDNCDYAANVEQAVARAPKGGTNPTAEKTKVATPGKHSIADVSAFLKVAPDKLVKTLIYLADGKPVAALVRGDRDVNEIKLKKALGASQLVLATDAAVREVTGAPVGFAGPVGLKVPVTCDLEVCAMSDFVVGANEADAHLTGVNIERDFTPTACGDYRSAAAGDACARCDSGHLKPTRASSRQVFYLGDEVLEADGRDVPGRRRPRSSRRRWAVTASASRASSRRRSSRTTTRTASSGRCRCAVRGRRARPAAGRSGGGGDGDAHLRRADRGRHRGAVRRSQRTRGREVQGRGSHRPAVPHRGRQEGPAEGVVELKRRRSPDVRKLKIDEVSRVVAAEVLAERS